MQVWRLIAHRTKGAAALKLMKEKNRIGIGWTDIGNLNDTPPKGIYDIASRIRQHYPTLKNSHTGGPSLWNLYHRMKPGDLVIVNHDHKRRCVFEVMGDYFYDSEDCIFGYGHQRSACLTSIPVDDLWQEVGAALAAGQPNYYTLALCSEAQVDALPVVYEEGARYSITSTAYERSPAARAACLARYGRPICAVCEFDFEKVYGKHGQGYIHVHHRNDLASSGPTKTNPEKDLIPLCPNCHAMVHRGNKTMPVEELERIYRQNNSKQPTARSVDSN